ncbi:MAG: GntP family transporter [Actinomycetaceae bacterium]|nr:GntP family transporter [Actinomycetaceae bacterium]
MGAGILLLIASVAIIVLLLMVIKFKMSAFVALLLVSLGTGLVAGIPIGDIIPVMTAGMAKTSGTVMIIVGLGAMLGRVIEIAGGADSLATYFTDKLGKKRIIGAVTIAAFILGIPVFFDVGFIILAPIVFGFARVAGINPLKLGLPVAGALLTVHVALPPHPGPVAGAATLGVNPGLQLLIGLPISAVGALIGFFVARMMKIDDIVLGESPATRSAQEELAYEEAKAAGVAESERPSFVAAALAKVKAPSAWTVLALIILPLAMIMGGTVTTMVTEKETPLYDFMSMFGSSQFALLVAALVAIVVIGRSQNWGLTKAGEVLDSALPAVAIIVFVTGAGGVFANVLVESGIGAALSDTLIATNMPIILAAFVISSALRASQGSATVAILTTAGLLADPIAAAAYTPLQATLVMLAISFGSLGLSHINDSGFWIVTKYMGLSVKDGLKTWTVLSTVFGVAGFAITWACFGVVTALGV